MSPAAFCEVMGSLTVHVALVTAVAVWITRRQRSQLDADWTWAASHALVLLVTAAAFVLPHLRPVTLRDLCSTTSVSALGVVCDQAGRTLVWGWLAGVAAMAAALVAGMLRAAGLVRSSTYDAELTELLAESAASLGLASRPTSVRVSAVCVSPFCWQFHRPAIIVPDLLLDFPAAEQRAVFKHELVHLAAQHPLHLFLQRIVEAIYWFHPLVWWASRQASATREFRCDAQAVTTRRDVADYLRSLLRLMEARVPPPARLPAGLELLGDASLLSRRAAILAETAGKQVAPTGKARPLAALAATFLVCGLIWLPVNPQASRRAHWSPWPTWSAHVLDASGISVRDYEIDEHRLRPHEDG